MRIDSAAHVVMMTNLNITLCTLFATVTCCVVIIVLFAVYLQKEETFLAFAMTEASSDFYQEGFSRVQRTETECGQKQWSRFALVLPVEDFNCLNVTNLCSSKTIKAISYRKRDSKCQFVFIFLFYDLSKCRGDVVLKKNVRIEVNRELWMLMKHLTRNRLEWKP